MHLGSEISKFFQQVDAIQSSLLKTKSPGCNSVRSRGSPFSATGRLEQKCAGKGKKGTFYEEKIPSHKGLGVKTRPCFGGTLCLIPSFLQIQVNTTDRLLFILSPSFSSLGIRFWQHFSGRHPSSDSFPTFPSQTSPHQKEPHPT